MREAPDGFDGGIVVVGRSYTELRYADDTVLMASDRAEMEMLIEGVRDASAELGDASAELGLRLNAKKTKMIVIGGSTDSSKIQIKAFAGDCFCRRLLLPLPAMDRRRGL